VKTDYKRYIPNGSQVSVVMTTRLSDAKKYASADPQNTKNKLFLRLSGLDTESAVDLVLEASDVDERSPQITEQATKIVTALDFHPLAINIASSLIQSAVYSLKEYADALESRLTQKELLDTESEEARYLKVSTTFEVSAESLQQSASVDPTAKAALSLLDIMGFMHHQDISEEIFVRAWEYEEKIISRFEGKDEDGDIEHLSAWHVTQSRSIFSSLPPEERTRLFRKARALLSRLSLVDVERAENCMSTHLLVHKWARERVSRQVETWTAAASILALSAQGHTQWQPFTPQLVYHLDTNFAILQDLPMSSKMSDQWGLCRTLCAYVWQMWHGKSTRTLDICLKLNSQTQGLPYNQLAVATVSYLLGCAYRDNGQIPEAINILKRTAESQEDHPFRLASQYGLGSAYLTDGQITQSIEILEHVVKVWEEKLREDHPDRLASQHELGSAYLTDGKITQAIEILEHVVKVREEKLREDHPDRLSSQHELGRAYWINGRTEKALSIQERIVPIAQRAYPAGHPERTNMEYGLVFLYEERSKECPPNKVLPIRTQSSPLRTPGRPDGERSS